MNPTTKTTSPRRVRLGGFTLLEVLIVLALLAVLLAGINSIIRLYSGHYSATERRVGRAQLTRSISQMLSDDLGAAVQDPIQSVADDPNRQFIRRFGLRGDSRSLQIDVVQPNLFATTATAAENRRVAAGGQKSAESRQVPELKTIFYEFVPINAREGADEETAATVPTDSAASGGENLGSEPTGSLSSAPGAPSSELGLDAATGANALNDPFGLNAVASRPLVRKYGLSRRELDFETPEEAADENAASADAVDLGFSEDLANGELGSTLGGSLSAPPDASKSTLASAGAEPGLTVAPDGSTTALDETQLYEPPLTAAQIALDADDGTTWAPEVLDCRFRYFDGENWLDSWDSLEKSGLPIAIKVELKLAPLDDVDLYRESPLLFNLPIPPKPEEIAKIAAAAAPSTGLAANGEFASELSGTLSSFGASSTPGLVAAPGEKTGVDAFNSYRTLAAFRIAKNAPAFEVGDAFSPLKSSLATGTGTANAAGTGTESGAETSNVAGTLGGASGDLTASGDLGVSGGLSGSGALGASTGPSAGAQSSLALAVFNERGICVDFANDGTYLTLEQMARELGVSEPTVCEVVAYLPTTPLGRTETLARRRPANVRPGAVAVPPGAGRESSATRRAVGANPYATGSARQVQRRTPNSRNVAERSVAGRTANERTAATRGVENRSRATREGVDRQAASRAVANRGGTERVATRRQVRTRDVGGTGTDLNAEIAAALDAEGDALGSGVGATEEFAGTTPVGGVGAPDPNGLGSATVGGLSGFAGQNAQNTQVGQTGATSLGGTSAFEIVDSQNVPFSSGGGGAGSGFDGVDAALGGANVQPGLIEIGAGGTPTVVSPTTRPNATPGKTQQTWIRGKK